MTAAPPKHPTFAHDYIKGDWDKSTFIADPHVDNLMTVVVGLGSEFWAMRRRLMVVETLLAGKGVMLAQEIEAYQPTAAQRTAWDAERDDFIQRVFSVLTRETLDDLPTEIPRETGEFVSPRTPE